MNQLHCANKQITLNSNCISNPNDAKYLNNNNKTITSTKKDIWEFFSPDGTIFHFKR